jgi:hypothetical protein
MKAMKRFLQTALVIMALVLSSGVFLVSPAIASVTPSPTDTSPFSASKQQACSAVDLSVSSTTSCDSATQGKAVNSLAATVISVLSYIVGAVAVIMIIVGGFRFIISGGDSNATASAKNTIIYALVGLAIAVLAQALVYFVLDKVR